VSELCRCRSLLPAYAKINRLLAPPRFRFGLLCWQLRISLILQPVDRFILDFPTCTNTTTHEMFGVVLAAGQVGNPTKVFEPVRFRTVLGVLPNVHADFRNFADKVSGIDGVAACGQ